MALVVATTATYGTLGLKVSFGTATYTAVTTGDVTVTPPTGAGAAIMGYMNSRSGVVANGVINFTPATGVFTVGTVTSGAICDWVVFYAS